MIVAHKIALEPNNRQETYFRKAAGGTGAGSRGTAREDARIGAAGRVIHRRGNDIVAIGGSREFLDGADDGISFAGAVGPSGLRQRYSAGGCNSDGSASRGAGKASRGRGGEERRLAAAAREGGGDDAMEEPRYEINDRVELRKPHPCGSREWEIWRTGMDFGIKCLGCGHKVMIPRKEFERAVRKHYRASDGGTVDEN